MNYTAVRLPLSEANPSVVRGLQEKYPNAELYIVPEDASAMDEGRFWELISLFDWSKTGNDDAVIEPVIRHLASLPKEAILSFYELLAEKLYLLDGKEFAQHSVEAGEHFSADLFLYARCCVVANGRETFEAVLANPAAFPKHIYFESMLEIPERAWLRKTGQKLEYYPKFIYETGFNPSGWGADTITI